MIIERLVPSFCHNAALVFHTPSKAVLVAHYCFPCLSLLDKEGSSVRQGQTYMHGRQGEQQRATRIDIYARKERIKRSNS
ncbi:hypothetical protein E2986_12794 [Frieseomelitta varia]|uniref:Uncharacterized protein n=1 Tax=Frieseomelitta varia TaxID=561572 RepID=A0A833RYL3_9HYME|nr:hypothetical protein E2986_12794 [Frieseomelitta varia]